MKFLFKVKQRYVVVVMVFFVMATVFALRMSFPIVLTQMVYVPNIVSNTETNQSTNTELICRIEHHMIENGTSHESNSSQSVPIPDSDRYYWSQKLQGMMLSSFYWGTILSEIPGAIIVQRVGSKLTLLISIALSALVTVLTPSAVQYGDSNGLIATRVILGFVQGPTFPCLAAFVVPWYPIEQRGRLLSIGYIGISAGGAFSTFISGLLMHHLERWDVVFYFFSAILVLLGISFAFICYELPKDNPFICDDEKEYLQQKIDDYENERKELPSTPWLSILKSSPVLALILSTALYSWSFYIINTDLPKYLNDVLHVSIENNAVYSSVPKILSILVSTGSGFLSDLMMSMWHVKRTRVQKIFVVLTSVVPATFLMFASYAGCHEILAVILLSVSIAAHGFNSAGAAINLFDLSPNYVAPLNAVINSLATVVGMSAPYIAGLLTPNALLSEWRMVFWITFALHSSESIIFTIWGSGEVQLFNSPKFNPK
ncbi:sialin-like [Sitodiplosis mosellana]|uniref:sialin-like n=1 Tax=Sitodiplosis mosellana TaxID=263140 RepID=UPI002443ECF0|nr:sialin-like [Sitodiplosis mosellana]